MKTMPGTESDNRMVWDREQSSHYEAWTLSFHHRGSATGFIIRYAVDAPKAGRGVPRCTIGFSLFDAERPARNLALHRVLPIGRFAAQPRPFRIAVDQCELTHGTLRGAIEGGEVPIEWDLRFEPSPFTHRHLPDLAYRGKRSETKVLSPNLVIHLYGRVRVGDRRFDVSGEPGTQSHSWGRKRPHAWAIGQCSTFREDGTAVLQATSVRLRRKGLVMPAATFVSLYLGGEVYDFHDILTLPLRRGRWDTGIYRFRANGRRARLEGEVRARAEDLIRHDLEDPDGELGFRHCTEVADATLTLWTRRSITGKFRQLCRLTARASAHLEHGGRQRDQRVGVISEPVD